MVPTLDRQTRPRVLIIEHDATQLETINCSLQEEGFDTLPCQSAQEALNKVSAGTMGIAIVNISQQASTAIQELHQLQNNNNQLRIILYTEPDTLIPATDAFSVGAFSVIEKNGHPHELIQQIHRAMKDWPTNQDARAEHPLDAPPPPMEKTSEYGRLFDQSFMEVYVVCPHTFHILKANRRARNNLGYPGEELTRLSLLDINPDLSIDGLQDFFAPLHDQKSETVHRETTHQRKHGSRYPVELYAQYSTDESDPAYVVMGLDITERKKEQEALNNLVAGTAAVASEQFFPQLVQHLADALEVEFAAVTEYRPPERVATLAIWHKHALSKNMEYALPDTPCEEVLQEGLAVYTKNVQSQFPKDQDLRILKAECYLGVALIAPDGTHLGHLFMVDSKPYQKKDWALSILKIFAARASAELLRQRTEVEKAQRESLLTLMLNTGPGCIKRVAADGTLLSMNPAGLQLIEATTEEEVLGRLVLDLVIPEHRPAFEQMHQNVIRGETETLQFQIQGLGGTQRWMETFAVPFHNPITKQVEHLAVTHDISERKQAEEELQKSELFLRSTLDILPANIAIVDDHGTVCLVNKAWHEFAEENGVEAPKVSEGTNYFHICDRARKNGDHEAASFAGGIQKILSGEISSFALEYPCISPEKERWFVGRVKRFSINDRYFAAIVHVDITDIKLAERDLRESESRLQAVIDGSLSVIYIKDLESRYFMVNRRYAEVLNIEKEAIVGLNDFDLFPAKTAEEFQGNDRTALASPVPLMFEEIAPHRDGPHTYLSNKFAFRDTNGEPYAICGISTDITELKQKEAELQNSKERIRRILDTLPAAAYTCDKNGLITYFNEPATILWGRQPQLNDPVDQYCGSFRLSNPDTTELAHDQCWMAKAINENRAISGKEALIQRPDGTVRSVLAHASPLRDATGSVIGGINVLVDVTEQQHTQTALKKSERAIRTLYEITSAQDLTFDEKIRALLKLGCQHFGLPLGTLTKRVGDQLELEYLHAPNTTWTEHMLIPICESFCGLTLERPEPLVCEHVKNSKWKSLPAYKALGLEAYIGTKVIAGDHIYGSLCFLDHQPYPGTFSHSTIDFLQLMARWIGSELERKHAEQALHQANDRLRTLSQQLLTVQETERHQLARDLHDEIGQTLTAVKLNLQSLQHKQGPAESPGVLVDSLDILDHMLKHVRELSLDLRPSMLDDLGLVSAVRWLVNRQAERAGWTTTIRIEEGLSALPQEFATASFRVVQEALTNIMRHAQASNVHVELHTDEKEIELHITDDGIGFDSVNVMGQNTTGQAFGLLSMHERVRFLNGKLTIISQRGKGTRILAKLPLPTVEKRTIHR